MAELLKALEFPPQCKNCPAFLEYIENKAFIETADLPQAEIDRRMREDLLELEDATNDLCEEAHKRPCTGATRTIYGNRGRGWVDLGYNCAIIEADMTEEL